MKMLMDSAKLSAPINNGQIRFKKRKAVGFSIIIIVTLLLVLAVATIPNAKGLLELAFYQVFPNSGNNISSINLVESQSTIPQSPLRVDPANPRYFIDGSGKAILLVGSDYWNLWQDGGRTNPPPAFDYDAYIQFALDHGYNYIKSQTWEEARHITDGQYWYIQPTIWARTGPGTALDGGLKFNLNVLNDAYFNRVRSRVLQAEQNGLYVVVDFFHGFSVTDKGNISDAWTAHPMNAANNVNGINGDPTNQGDGMDVDTLVIPAVTAYQKAYIAHMIDTLNDLNNVIWEIALEPDGSYSRDGHSTQEWEEYMINYIHSYEATKAKRHPVLYSVEWPGGDNNVLMASNAEAISPNESGGYASGDPPESDGTKVILTDTDHILWPYGDTDWGWKMFTRGMGGIFFMDQSYSTYDDQDGEAGGTYSENENFRYNMPRGDLCSSGYCLANPVTSGAEYLVYLPAGSTVQNILHLVGINNKHPSNYLLTDSAVSVDLSAASGLLTVEWYIYNTALPVNGAVK